jgi:hypothetical protein
MTASAIAFDVMNTPQEKLAKLSVVDYATHVGGIYVFYTETESVYGVDHESTRFLTFGQSRNHNAALMWNPSLVQFTDNICPYKERLNPAFVTITKTDCLNLFIDYITLVDAEITRTEALLVEKACHDQINGLKLGRQRLHRVPGASFKIPEDGSVKRRIVGATFLPPFFFERHKDIVIMGSADGQH